MNSLQSKLACFCGASHRTKGKCLNLWLVADHTTCSGVVLFLEKSYGNLTF